MQQLQIKMASKIGPLYFVSSEQGLHGIFWKKQNVPMTTEKNTIAAKILQKAIIQMEEYLDGKRKKFDLLLNPQGTDFQKKVWNALAKIPYGETRSYKEIAITINHTKAYRAVGTANGQNPLSIIVPCHRVIATDGSIGGYAGGLSIKRKLLALEAEPRP